MADHTRAWQLQAVNTNFGLTAAGFNLKPSQLCSKYRQLLLDHGEAKLSA
jgi:hypothetical protein